MKRDLQEFVWRYSNFAAIIVFLSKYNGFVENQAQKLTQYQIL